MRRWAAGLAVARACWRRRACSVGRRRRRAGRRPTSAIRATAPSSTWPCRSEKIALMTDLAQDVQRAPTRRRSTASCVFARPQSKASGAATTLLADGWDEDADGPRPVIWSPAASAWGAILNQRLADDGQPAMAPEAEPFMHTPLVIAMPKPMADALGYPDDARRLGRHPRASPSDAEGWAAYGHPEWGPFRLGKTNPNFSTSGLSALIAQAYAATGKTERPVGRGPRQPRGRGVRHAASSRRSSTTATPPLTFLNNWYRADQRGHVAHLRVGRRRRGEVGHRLQRAATPTASSTRARSPASRASRSSPSTRRRARSSRTTRSSSSTPPWVTDEERRGRAAASRSSCSGPRTSARCSSSASARATPTWRVGAPIVAANGVDPTSPTTLLEVPDAAVHDRPARQVGRAAQERPGAARARRVRLDERGGRPDTGETRLDLAKRAAIEALDQFKDEDEVGLRIFTTNDSARRAS